MWTRIYTHRLPSAERRARLAEIESDLWEFEHDSDAPTDGWRAVQVLARLVLGIRDDVAWRMDVGMTENPADLRALPRPAS